MVYVGIPPPDLGPCFQYLWIKSGSNFIPAPHTGNEITQCSSTAGAYLNASRMLGILITVTAPCTRRTCSIKRHTVWLSESYDSVYHINLWVHYELKMPSFMLCINYTHACAVVMPWWRHVAMIHLLLWWCTCCYDTRVAMVMHMLLWYTCVAMVMHMLPPCLPLEWDNCYDPPGHSCMQRKRRNTNWQTHRHTAKVCMTVHHWDWLAVTNQKSSLSGTLSSLRSWQ